MIVVVAVLLVTGGPLIALGLRALERRGARLSAPPAPRMDAATAAQLHRANAADWDLIADRQRQIGMPMMAVVSEHWADEARAKARRIDPRIR